MGKLEVEMMKEKRRLTPAPKAKNTNGHPKRNITSGNGGGKH